MQAAALTGAWTVRGVAGPALAPAMRAAVAANEVDRSREPRPTRPRPTSMPPPSLATGPVRPSTEHDTHRARCHRGAPDYVPVTGTPLLYVQNTTAESSSPCRQRHLCADLRPGTGALADGPWTYVRGKELPADFRQDSGDESVQNLKASVPVRPRRPGYSDGPPQVMNLDPDSTVRYTNGDHQP